MDDAPLTREMLEPLAGQPDKLIDIVLQQAAAIVSLRKLAAEQRQIIQRLERRVSELEERLGGSGGGAAPFRLREDKRSRDPKKPGRGKGHRGDHRATPDQVDQSIDVPLEACPQCGGEVGARVEVVQHLIELPPIKPLVIRLRTWRGRCTCCGEPCASGHPLQVSHACGAAGTHLGARALGVAAHLRHALGLTVRGSCRALDGLFGLKISPGGLCQALDRVAARNRDAFGELERAVVSSPVVHTDETGWWLQNGRASLWVMCHEAATLYRVVEHKDRATFHETIPPDWPGVLVSDCLSVYDEATPLQHKCYSHHLKAIARAREQAAQPGGWLEDMRRLLLAAIALGKERENLGAESFARSRRALELAASALLDGQGPPRRCPQEEAVRQRLLKQRDHLFVFLDHAGVEATNNLAERQLRPAVIRRKLSCGNKTRRGAATFEILGSLAATCRQTGEDFLAKVTANIPIQRA